MTMHLYRTHTCGALRAENIDDQVRLSGWVHRKRDHGGLLFIDVRDETGGARVGRRNVAQIDEKTRMEHLVPLTTY